MTTKMPVVSDERFTVSDWSTGVRNAKMKNKNTKCPRLSMKSLKVSLLLFRAQYML